MLSNHKAHICPECKSDNWDYPNIGIPGSIQCLDCGNIYPEVLSLFPSVVKTESPWPFPTKSNPLKPWTPEQVKEHKEKNTQEAPF